MAWGGAVFDPTDKLGAMQAGLIQTAFIILSGLLLWGIRTRPDDGYGMTF